VTTAKPGFIATIKSYPGTFWVANTMEIFERMSWYGMFTVLALYVTAPIATGGLGFTSEARGNIQALITFLLYLMGVLTGALADRYGYKRMFIIAYLTMMVAYTGLSYCTTVPTFLFGFFIVAIGAAIFKPVVVGTVARVSNESNSAMAFGIFYMMVNIGGFVGPIVAGLARGWGWEYVFYASSTWAGVNLLIVALFYKEPTSEAGSKTARTLQKVLDDLVEVLGNLRFFITVFVVLIAIMLASFEFDWFTWRYCWYFIPIWLALNFLYDRVLSKDSGGPTKPGAQRRNSFLKRMYCSNWRFAIFLLIMSGFWTSFNQIFYTMPEYIRDFTETRPFIELSKKIQETMPWGFPFGKRDPADPTTFAEAKVATISDKERDVIVGQMQSLLDEAKNNDISPQALSDASRELLDSKVRISPDSLGEFLTADEATADSVTERAITLGRQFNPEFIVNFDAGAIVLFQVLVSFFMAKFHRFTTMIVGMVIAAIGIGLSAFAGDTGLLGAGGLVWIVAGGIVIFAFGEMMASPTSQEYVGRIAPDNKKALYMGYYFVAIALGNLFGGILSGQLYGKLARDMQRPDLMWLAFGGIMLGTAIIFLLYNIFALPKHASGSLTNNKAA
jgi:MFS family permease